MNQENKFLNKSLLIIIALITLNAMVLIRQFSPYIPDYDGLDYFRVAKLMNGWLFSLSDHKIYIKYPNSYVTYWPISNSVSVGIAAFLLRIMDVNLLPTLINSLYLCLFVCYLKKIKSISYVYIATLLLCSHVLFFRLFTTLTTEFSVGLWIFSFLLTLNSNHVRRGIYLAVLIVFGLLLRTLDIVFILMSVSAYSLMQYVIYKNKQHIFISLRYVGLTIIFTLPLFFQHYKTTYEYIHQVSFGPNAVAWKSLGGVSDRYDVILQYAKYLYLYNPYVILVAIATILFGFLLKIIPKSYFSLVIGSSFAAIAPLFLASSLNIQVVFWVYSSLIFIICEFGTLLICALQKKKYKLYLSIVTLKNVFLSCITIFLLIFIVESWNYEVVYLRQQNYISKIAFDISSVFDDMLGSPPIAFNYHGVGALDNNGLAWGKEITLPYGGISDIYSKNKSIEEYLELTNSTQFFIAAHDNYFFPPHFGINDHIKETNCLFTEKSSEFGFRKVKEVSRDGNNFDIWYRPGVQAQLQYASYGDNWISQELSIVIGTEALCAGEKFSGKLMLSLSFPNPNIANYDPPFLITLTAKNSKDIISSAWVNNYGNAYVILELNNKSCGDYVISFDKSFSTNNDHRKLSAMFIKLEGANKFVWGGK